MRRIRWQVPVYFVGLFGNVAETVAFSINRSTKIEIHINVRSLIRSHCQDSQEWKWFIRFSSVFLVRLTFTKKTSRDRIFYQIVSLAHWRTRSEVIVVWTMEFSPVENPPVRFIGRVQNIATQQFRALVSFLRHRRKENTHCLSDSCSDIHSSQLSSVAWKRSMLSLRKLVTNILPISVITCVS